MKNGKLNGKVAVVTGASKGIGAGIARQFAAEGAAVVVNYASSKEGADRVVDEISKRGGKAIAVQGDVAKKKDIERLFAEGKKSFGRIDILVNNAGAYDFKPLEEVTETEFHREFNTNVLGLLLATQEAAKHFSADGGSVINVSSVASSTTPPNSTIYTATKGAVDAITRALAKELGPRKIRINAVNPGGIETNGRADAARSYRTTARRRTGSCVSGFLGIRMDHRRNHPCRRRISLIDHERFNNS
jgi:3-oxoacyl-[acyl-carrier protein] reductase